MFFPPHKLLFLALLFLSNFFSTTSPLECYSCFGSRSSECELGLTNSTTKCETNTEQCITIIINGKSNEVIYKGCFLSCKVIEEVFEFFVARSTEDEMADVFLKSCRNCDKTKCNFGSKQTQGVTYLTFVLIISYLFKKIYFF